MTNRSSLNDIRVSFLRKETSKNGSLQDLKRYYFQMKLGL